MEVTIRTPPTSLLLQQEEREAETETEGYSEKFNPPLPNAYECPVCLLVLRAAVQTECGHRFCMICIKRTFQACQGEQVCPVDNQPLTEDEIHPDNFARRKILMSFVLCNNEGENGCPWTGMLKDHQDHLQECPFQEVECEYGCGQKIQRQLKASHVETECPKRPVECQYCSMTYLFEKMKDHNFRCPKFPVICPKFCSSATIRRENVEEHLEYECPLVEVTCPFAPFGCEYKDKREELLKHMRVYEIKHMSYIVSALDINSDETERKKRFLNELRGSNPEAFIAKIVQMNNVIGQLNVRILKLEDKVQEAFALEENNRLTTRKYYDGVNEELFEVKRKLDSHETLIKEVQAKVWGGRFIWRIMNFEGLFQEAKSGATSTIHSTPFYNAIPGYKFCTRLNLNGVDTGANSHVSVFLHMMQGEFDSMLSWPYTGKINISVIDQNEEDKKNVTETLIARPGLQAFLRPTSPRNHKGYGYVEMIPHHVMRTRGYVKNDTMLIDVEFVEV